MLAIKRRHIKRLVASTSTLTGDVKRAHVKASASRMQLSALRLDLEAAAVRQMRYGLLLSAEEEGHSEYIREALNLPEGEYAFTPDGVVELDPDTEMDLEDEFARLLSILPAIPDGEMDSLISEAPEQLRDQLRKVAERIIAGRKPPTIQ